MPRESIKSKHDAPLAEDALYGLHSWLCSRPQWLWLVLVLSGLGLFGLSRVNFLVFHALVETFSIILAAAVFLIAWNTRFLSPPPLFLILATGFMATAGIDLLHMLSYQGMGIFPDRGSDLPTQFWIAGRYLYAATFFLAALSLGRSWQPHRWGWLGSFLLAAGLLTAAIWPLGIFPACLVEGQGLTSFKVGSEYLVIVVLILSGGMIYAARRRLSRRLVNFLLFAILFNVLSELSFTLYQDIYGPMNFLGHYLKLATSVVVYIALVEGVLRDPYSTLFRELAASNQALESELQKRQESEAEKRIVNQEFSLLYRLARVFQSTLQLDDLTHLILSAATSLEGGGFERAMLFTVNQRTGVIQGMLGIDQQTSCLVLPEASEKQVWEKPLLDRESMAAQRKTEFNKRVVKQRLPLLDTDNPLARAFLTRQVLLFPDQREQPSSVQALTSELGLGLSACVPLLGRHEVLGVLVVDTPLDREGFSTERLRFLELFARQAGAAMENAQLVQRLEGAHDELRDVQERLIEGEKLAVLGEMAAQVAHELKNPLVSIGGFASRLTRLDLGEAKANEYAAIISREVRRLEEMLANILAFSKKQLVCLEDCEVDSLLAEVLLLEQAHCARQGIEVIVEKMDDLPIVTGDCQQLRQVLLNLMVNARQSMADGGSLTLRVSTGLLRGDEAIVLEVEDTGGGIAPEVMRNIFNPFFSTHTSGTGLGLSISHRIIEHHHGEIEVRNSELGARFIVRIPVRPPFLVRR